MVPWFSIGEGSADDPLLRFIYKNNNQFKSTDHRYSTCGVYVKSYKACQENVLVIFHPKENNIYSWIFCINKIKPSLVPLVLTDIDIYNVN